MLALAQPPCPPLCPHCGIDLIRRADVELGDLRVSLYGDTSWRGERVALTRSEAEIVQALARCAGRYVQPEALLNITGSEGDSNVIAVLIHRTRAKFRAVDPGFNAIESRMGFGQSGYRWAA